MGKSWRRGWVIRWGLGWGELDVILILKQGIEIRCCYFRFMRNSEPRVRIAKVDGVGIKDWEVNW